MVAKIKLGKRQVGMIVSTLMAMSFKYYGDKVIQTGGGFSEGFMAGFLYGFVAVCSLGALYFFGEMLYLNFKVRVKSK
jgi:hypothetical protein